MEISIVRQRLLLASARAKERARQHRQRTDEAARAYTAFLRDVATPLTKQLAGALKAESHAFTVSTPEDGLRLALDRSRDDYIEFVLDVSSEQPEVALRISRTRGSRTLVEERPIRAGARLEALTDDDVLTALLSALEPWLER